MYSDSKSPRHLKSNTPPLVSRTTRVALLMSGTFALYFCVGCFDFLVVLSMRDCNLLMHYITTKLVNIYYILFDRFRYLNLNNLPSKCSFPL